MWMEMQRRRSCSRCKLSITRRDIVFYCICNEAYVICSECAKERRCRDVNLAPNPEMKADPVQADNVSANDTHIIMDPLSDISRKILALKQETDPWCMKIFKAIRYPTAMNIKKVNKIDRRRIKKGR